MLTAHALYHHKLSELQEAKSVIAACESIRTSNKLRRMLEVVLAFGNYMNSQKRGVAYGFKLSTLDRVSAEGFLLVPFLCGGHNSDPTPPDPIQLLDVKSKRNVPLLRFVAQAMQEKYPESCSFMDDLVMLTRASKGGSSIATREGEDAGSCSTSPAPPTLLVLPLDPHHKVSLSTLQSDVHSLKTTIQGAQAELELDPENATLKHFVSTNEPKYDGG